MSASDDGRWFEVPPERVARWLAEFDEKHPVARTVYTTDQARFEAADGALAECHPPFPPLPERGTLEGLATQPLVSHVQRDRVVGVLLVRPGGHAAGVFDGDRLVASKVGSRSVQGRARQHPQRRHDDAGEAVADDAARVLVPRLKALQAVVLGGDRRAVDALREDPRLAPVFKLAVERFLVVPDPRLAVLSAAPRMFRTVRARLVEPPA